LKFTVSKTEKGKIVVEVNGLTASSRFNSRTSYNEAAFALGIDALTLRAAVTQASTRGLSETPIEVEVCRETKDQGPTSQVYRVRNRLSPETSSYSSFSDALTHPAGDDSVIEWESIDETAAVDFDWHGVPSPEAPQLTAAVYQERGTPTHLSTSRRRVGRGPRRRRGSLDLLATQAPGRRVTDEDETPPRGLSHLLRVGRHKFPSRPSTRDRGPRGGSSGVPRREGG
jgi:hypothetical protein